MKKGDIVEYHERDILIIGKIITFQYSFNTNNERVWKFKLHIIKSTINFMSDKEWFTVDDTWHIYESPDTIYNKLLTSLDNLKFES